VRGTHPTLDFGQGWSVSYQNTKIEESRIIGEGWELNQYGTSPSKKFCIEPIGKPHVMVTLPNGDVETFNAAVTEQSALFQAPPNPVLVFEPESDTFSSERRVRPTHRYWRHQFTLCFY
jgi:hypothetical protein